jgi:tetratricopeptide (TPR) repeat protein
LDQGSGDPLERAQLLSLDASYVRTMGEFETAESILEEALNIYTAAGDTHLQGRTLFKMGDAIGYVQPERGIEYIRRAMGLVNTSREPRLELCAHHDLVFFLVHAGRPEEALAALDRARPLYKQFPDDYAQLRLHWMEGKIARGMGHLDEAAQALRKVWEDFRERELHYDLLMVSLDLAETHVTAGDHETAARFAAEVYELMAEWKINHYALAAWLVLQNALELGEAEDILTRIRGYFLRHWHQARGVHRGVAGSKQTCAAPSRNWLSRGRSRPTGSSPMTALRGWSPSKWRSRSEARHALLDLFA